MCEPNPDALVIALKLIAPLDNYLPWDAWCARLHGCVVEDIARAIGPKRPGRDALLNAADCLYEGTVHNLDTRYSVAAFLRELAEADV